MNMIFALITFAHLFWSVLAVPTPAVGEPNIIKTAGVPDSDTGQVFCNLPGNPCWVVKRAAFAVADTLVQRRWFRGHGWTNFCGGPGTSCKRHVGELILAQNRDRSLLNYENFDFCSFPGISCTDKRAALEKIGAAAEKALISVDNIPDAVMQNTDTSTEDPRVSKREAKPWWNWFWGGHTAFCGAPGTSCHKKRISNPDPAPSWRNHGFWGFCGTPGSGCARKRDAEELAQIDSSVLIAAQRAVDAVNATDPTVFRNLCFVEDGDCNLILKARDAFLQVRSKVGNFLTVISDDAEHICTDSQGACTIARRILDEFERTVLEAARDVEAY